MILKWWNECLNICLLTNIHVKEYHAIVQCLIVGHP